MKTWVEVLDLGGKAHGVAGQIVGLDLRHAAPAGEQALPNLRGGLTDPAEEAHARYNDAMLLRHLLPSSSLTIYFQKPYGFSYLLFWFFSM